MQLLFTIINTFHFPQALQTLASAIPHHPPLPAKVTFKKSNKKYAKTYKCKVTVKNPGIRIVENPTVLVGEKTNATTKTWPNTAKLTYTSSDETVATVDATGKVTGVKAGEATITVKLECGTKTLTKTTKVTVKEVVAELSTISQVASNAFTATFTADASKSITKDDFKVAATDGSVELAVKSVEHAADGMSAKVTVFGNFTNGATYKVTCKDKVFDLTAKVGEVARVVINTATAEQNVETPINFTLFDADNIDVTPNVNLDTTCYVSISGNYSAASIDKPSKASVTMNVVGDKAEVTISYNSNAVGAQDITATQTITCVDTKAVQGTKLFKAYGDVNAKSDCHKFYLGTSDTSVSISEGQSIGNGNTGVYFCAKDSKGEVISYDTYEVDSSNDDVANASVLVDSGKFAKFALTGNTVGSATLNIKATKNGKDTYYTIPVSVTKRAEAVRMSVSVTKPTMSNVADSDYNGAVLAKLYDKDGKEVTGTFSYEVTNNSSTTSGGAFSVNTKGVYSAARASAKTYTIKVTGADANTGKTFVRNVNVAVKSLPEKDSLNLTYQIEFVAGNVVDMNPVNYPAYTNDDSVKVRLYATHNGLFAGYVRKGANGVTIAEGNVTASDKIENVKVAAKFGTDIFAPGALYVGTVTDGAVKGFGEINSSANTIFAAVKNGSEVVWTPEGSKDLAKEGAYTIEYRIYTKNGSYTDKDAGNGKYNSRTQTFTVKNSVFRPTVTVTSRTAESLTLDGIQKCLKTNVDMNNNQSDYESIVGIAKDKDGGDPVVTSNNRMTVKYAVVVDNYGNTTWKFYIPINATFKTE